MARKLASIQQIISVEPIVNSENLELVRVLGWQCVVNKKDKFKVNDKIVYLEIDSICPEIPEFEFLRDRKFRIKTIKLRGVLSQGLVVPLSILSKGKYKIGDDVTDILKITQYIPESEREGRGLIVSAPKNKILKWMMRFNWFKYLWKKFNKPQTKSWPSWISKTDEERIQNMPWILKDKTKLYYSTIKMDGSSMTLAVKDKDFVICSRNVRLSEKDKDSNFVKMALKVNYKDVLTKIKNFFNATTVILQGEMCGPGIQDNKYQLNDLELFIFNLIIDGNKKPTWEIQTILDKLNANIRTVPILMECKGGRTIKETYAYTLPDTVDEMLTRSHGDSLYYPTIREGIVVRSVDQEISFKVINNDYLLQEKDDE